VNVHVVAADWNRHGAEMRRVREAVFIEEQGVSREEEWDGLDETARHFVALNEAGQALGTARLLPSGQIGRMAVLKPQRGRGIGRRLLDCAVEAATAAGLPRVFLHAQLHAVPFYRKAGFDVDGEEFVEAGIPHVSMVRLLPIAFAAAPGAPAGEIVNRAADPGRSAVNRVLPFGDEVAARGHLLDVIRLAEREVCIASPDLDPHLFGAPECVEILSRLVRRAAVPRVRMIVEDTRGIASSGHRLLELARRLPSKIQIRKLPNDPPAGSKRSFAVVDERSLWVMPDRERYTGFANHHDRVEARRLVDEFDRLFDRSTEDPELRLITL
jgi:predicted GNAT family N-acyltransferase